MRGILICENTSTVAEYPLPTGRVISFSGATKDLPSTPEPKRGPLVKISAYLKQKNLRYVVLDSGHLLYYLDQSAQAPHTYMYQRGNLDLSQYLLSKSHKSSGTEPSFALVTKEKGDEGKKYIFFCKDLIELRDWEEAIVDHMRAVKRARAFPKDLSNRNN
jgi:hypothetical protein